MMPLIKRDEYCTTKCGRDNKNGCIWKTRSDETNFFLYYIFCVHLSVLKPVASFDTEKKEEKKEKKRWTPINNDSNK